MYWTDSLKTSLSEVHGTGSYMQPSLADNNNNSNNIDKIKINTIKLGRYNRVCSSFKTSLSAVHGTESSSSVSFLSVYISLAYKNNNKNIKN